MRSLASFGANLNRLELERFLGEMGSSALPPTKSPNEGPALRRSENLLARRGFGDDVAVTVEGSLTVVAKQRFCGRREGRASKRAEATKRLAGGRMAAIAICMCVYERAYVEGQSISWMLLVAQAIN